MRKGRRSARLSNALSCEQIRHCEQRVGDLEAYLALGQTAFEYFLERSDELTNTYHLERWARYAWDMDTATLTFSDRREPRVVATIEFAGSYASVPQTWMWSWANPSIADSVTGRMSKVRDYGRSHNLAPLYADHWHAPEVHALEMTAVTAYLLGARGGYRVPGFLPGTTIYMVVVDAHWVG